MQITDNLTSKEFEATLEERITTLLKTYKDVLVALIDSLAH